MGSSYIEIVILFILFATFGLITQYGGPESVILFVNNIIYPDSNQPKLERIPGSKWIVMTSIQYPTEDNLANQSGWNLVMVADTKTPVDWNYPGVHFLSLERQKKLFGKFAKQLPLNSYTRKNLGYLYAIKNGAKWIYDTDDDNKPYGLGLSQFDYTSNITGLRYISKSDKISEKLFNPYRFYGFTDMWPRGFPLKFYEGHTNGKDKMISCREMPSPVVQQGIVNVDPDVDAIYRLVHAKKDSGLNVTFNNLAPSIILESGTYSPWNSQNTLFHYKAFFVLYLPTTVTFRVTDIWRSYFGQKLLHLIGENIAFYPANAVQYRNSHNYLNDFHQEIDVYEQSGSIVEFLDSWTCTSGDIVKCALELADEFLARNYFMKKDRELIVMWFELLKNFGYQFPLVVNATIPLSLPVKYSNCREANLDVGVDTYPSENERDQIWASETINGFGEVLEWCGAATGENDTFLPTVGEFLHRFNNMTNLNQKKDTVLVLVSNQNWRPTIVGLLQRMYSPFFKTTIFCGTWSDPSADPGFLAPIEPINFVNITKEEMRDGASYGYCVPKVKDLRLQNVAGYYFMADDVVFNIWYELPLDKFLNPNPTGIYNDTFWWRTEQINRSYELFENRCKNDPKFGKSWQEHLNILEKAHPGANIADHYLNTPLKTMSDFYYVPTNTMEYFGNLIEVMTEAEVFVEVAIAKLMDGLDFNKGGPFLYMWSERSQYFKFYNSSMIGFHALKLSELHTNLEARKKYCNSIVKTFGEEIYGLKKEKQVSLLPNALKSALRLPNMLGSAVIPPNIGPMWYRRQPYIPPIRVQPRPRLPTN